MSSSAGVVTLLFTDLVASTEMLARIGDDDAEELRRVHFSLLRSAISTGGGQEVKTLGDGVMVAFTSSLQAIRSAVAIQQATEEHNGRDQKRPLRVRIGLHAGEPVQEDDDFHGTTVVIAKRLCDAADGGQILASDLVRELVGSRGGFTFRPAGRLRLKGLPEPVAAATVEWRPSELETPPARRSRPEAATPRGPRLVGRDPEMSILEEELGRACEGEFRCVLLVGEPGVGKTRLGAELLARHRDDTIGLSARAHPLGTTTPFGVWTEALERHLRAMDAADIERLCAGFLDDLAQLLRSVAAVRGRGPDREPPRSRLLDGLAVVTAHLAGDQPVVVVLDDVHNADPSSLETLDYVAHSCVDDRLLVLLTARTGEISAGSAAGEILLGLEQEGLLRRLPLGPLQEEGLRALAETLANQAVPDTLVAWLQERSQGNPFFALGLVRALLERGADLSAPALERLPETLSERVAGRLSHLDKSAVTVLELLAVLGRQAELRSIVAVSGTSPDELGEILDQLVRSRFVAEEERGLQLVYEISHPLVQEAVYDGIGAARRRRLHRQVGQALVSAGRLGEAAPHFVRSAEPGDIEAVKVLVDAVRQAEEREAYQESLAILAAMVDILPAGDPRWADVVDALTSDAHWVIDHRADVHAVAGIPALRAMDQALGALDDPIRQAQVKFRLACFLGWGTSQVEEADSVCRQALALFQQAGDRRAELLTRHQLLQLSMMGRGYGQGYWEHLQQLADDARSFGDESVTRHVLRSVAQAGVVIGRHEETRQALIGIEQVAHARGDAYAVMAIRGYAVCNLAGEGHAQEAERLLARIKADYPGWQSTPLVAWQTMVSWIAGDYRLTVERGHEALAGFPGRMSRQLGAFLSFAAQAATEMGNVPDAERFLVRSKTAYGADESTYLTDLVELAEAKLAFALGAPHEGTALLRQAVTRLLERDMAATFPVYLQFPEWLDQPELAARVADDLERRWGETGTGIARAYARFGRASATAAAGDRQEAARIATEALELFSAFDVNGFRACALELLGRVRLDHDQPGALDALESAAALFDAGGATRRRDQVVEMLRNLGSQGRRVAAAAFGPASLTGREREVARLAAQGYSAREIGERLYIGARTVEGHLARAYAKLGVASKVELARRADELGLGDEDENA